jgi:hypothetical protein
MERFLIGEAMNTNALIGRPFPASSFLPLLKMTDMDLRMLLRRKGLPHGATWTLPPPESLYGGVVAEAFRSEGLEVPGATVFTSVTAVRNALLATGRFLSIVQGSVVRFRLLGPQFKVRSGCQPHAGGSPQSP